MAMRTVFSNAPDLENMVTEPGLPIRTQGRNTVAILCVECGWEGTAVPPDEPAPIFMEHPCRLTAWSQSAFD